MQTANTPQLNAIPQGEATYLNDGWDLWDFHTSLNETLSLNQVEDRDTDYFYASNFDSKTLDRILAPLNLSLC